MSVRMIGVTGGIGSGKSVVCRVCALRGIPVYDCDSRAKDIMRLDPDIRAFLLAEVGEDTYLPDGSLDRRRLASHIFNDAHARRRVEAEVHRAVRHDLEGWCRSLSSPHGVALVESAILHTSGLDGLVDRIWLVSAPDELRVERVQSRSSLTRAEVEARMQAQKAEFDALPAAKVQVIANDGLTPLLPRIDTLLEENIR